MNKIPKQEAFSSLTPRMAWQLAAPHTWPAAILPVFIACGAAAANTGVLSVTLAFTLLFISVLMQSAANTFNDYYDYVKGTDSAEDNVDPTDAVLIYNKVNPKHALYLAVGFLVAAFSLGIYVIAHAGWIPLVIGLIGAAVTVVYSAGKTPISYLPIGELVSGGVMGGLIALASYQALTLSFNLLMLAWALPTVIGIGLIMMTNNGCDIEKDIRAHRHTLPVKLGRAKTRFLYHGSMLAWIIAIIADLTFWFPRGLVVAPFMLLAAYPLMRALWLNPLLPESRIGAMAQICSVNVALGAFYGAALFLERGTFVLL